MVVSLRFLSSSSAVASALALPSKATSYCLCRLLACSSLATARSSRILPFSFRFVTTSCFSRSSFSSFLFSFSSSTCFVLASSR